MLEWRNKKKHLPDTHSYERPDKIFDIGLVFNVPIQPVSVAQLDVRPTDELEVVGSTPARSATFFRGDLIMKYFLRSFSPFR